MPASAPDTCVICDRRYTPSKRRVVACHGCERVCCLACVLNYAKISSRDGVPACLFGCGVMWAKPFILNFISAGAYRGMVRYCLERDFAERHEGRFEDRIQRLRRIDAKIRATEHELRALRSVKKRALEHCAASTACPTNGCIGVLVCDDGSQCAECLVCSGVFCADCLDQVTPGAEGCATCVGCRRAMIADAPGFGCRRCPVCRIYIEKDGGCDSMFCAHCHATFDWVSGSVSAPVVPEDAQLSLPEGRLGELSATGGSVVAASVYAYRQIYGKHIPFFKTLRRYDPLGIAVVALAGKDRRKGARDSRGALLMRHKETSDYAAVMHDLYAAAGRRLREILVAPASCDEASLVVELDALATGLCLCASEHGRPVRNDAFFYRRVAARAGAP